MSQEKNDAPKVPLHYSEMPENEMYVSRASASNMSRTFLEDRPNISIRSEYTRTDYDYYRPSEANQNSSDRHIYLSMKAYDNVGIVRNVIDLMSDFACKGIKLVHANPAQENFYKKWWAYVDGERISERFLNYLYRIANVPVNRISGKIPVRVEKKWSSAKGVKNIQDYEETQEEYRVIPLKYTFLNPRSLEPILPELSMFTGKPCYGLRLSKVLTNSIAQATAKNAPEEYKNLIKCIPTEIMQALKTGQQLIPVNSDNISIYFYKKDDWDVWAKPMISAIIDDLTAIEKMKLADMSALDGAISNVRLWRLGKLTDNAATTILPQPGAIAKVRNILANNIAGGCIDLVWGPDLEFLESSTKIHEFLGKDKYEVHIQNVYAGLGVPFAAGGGGTGMTNNFIAMQTFVERLEYGRRVLVDFWNEELKKVQKAMKYSKPALVSFDQINLGDDSSYKKLLMDLLDRDVISIDTALDNFKIFSEVEKSKIKREYNSRKVDKLPAKASPFHSPQTEDEFKKIILQAGGVTPSELGVDLLPKKEGELAPMDKQADQAFKLADKQNEHNLKVADKNNQAKVHLAKYKPRGTNGRPSKSKDSKKRKQKVMTTKRSKASNFVDLFIWAYNAQKQINDIVTPTLLERSYAKPNVRSLTHDEFEELETIKFIILSNLLPFEKVDANKILELTAKTEPNADIVYSTKGILATFKKRHDREPTIDEMRQIQATGYSIIHEQELDISDAIL
jgi:hypothetical protein